MSITEKIQLQERTSIIRIIQADGGGAKGPIETAVLKELEKNLITQGKINESITEYFHLGSGSSVGAIIMGAICSGRSAQSVHTLLMDNLDTAFTRNRRWPWEVLTKPKYNAKITNRLFLDILGEQFLMQDCAVPIMTTSVSCMDGRTHFFKSWEQKDGKLHLARCINRSYAAAYYFGNKIENDTKTVWADGGEGLANCTIWQIITECARQQWLGNTEIRLL